MSLCTSKSSGVVLYTIRITPELFEVRLSLVFKITGIDKAHSGHFKCGCYLNSETVLCLEELGFLTYNF